MSESELFNYQTDLMVHVFAPITRPQWGEIEKEIKTESISQWLAACETLQVSSQERRLQITDILTRPASISVAHLGRVMRKSMVDATDEAIEAVATHGNAEGNHEKMVELITFLFRGRP